MTEDEVKALIEQMIEPLKRQLEDQQRQLDRQATEIKILKEGGNL